MRRRRLFSIVILVTSSATAVACGAEPAADTTPPPVTDPTVPDDTAADGSETRPTPIPDSDLPDSDRNADTDLPDSDIGEQDLASILAAVAAQRFLRDNSFGGATFSTRLLVVDTVGSVDDEGLVVDGGAPIGEPARNAIVAALEGTDVEFISSEEATTHVSEAIAAEVAASAGTASALPPDPVPVLRLGSPEVIDGQLTVASSLWCGSLCAIGGAHVVERSDDGTWVVTGTTGPVWVS